MSVRWVMATRLIDFAPLARAIGDVKSSPSVSLDLTCLPLCTCMFFASVATAWVAHRLCGMRVRQQCTGVIGSGVPAWGVRAPTLRGLRLMLSSHSARGGCATSAGLRTDGLNPAKGKEIKGTDSDSDTTAPPNHTHARNTDLVNLSASASPHRRCSTTPRPILLTPSLIRGQHGGLNRRTGQLGRNTGTEGTGEGGNPAPALLPREHRT